MPHPVFKPQKYEPRLRKPVLVGQKIHWMSIDPMQPEWRRQLLYFARATGRAIVLHRGKIREAFLRVQNDANTTLRICCYASFCDTCPMRGVTAWAPAPQLRLIDY